MKLDLDISNVMKVQPNDLNLLMHFILNLSMKKMKKNFRFSDEKKKHECKKRYHNNINSAVHMLYITQNKLINKVV